MRSTLLFASLSLLLTACAAGGSNSSSTFGDSGGSGGSGEGGSHKGGAPPMGGGGAGGVIDPATSSSTGGGSNQPAEVFAEGPNTLYKLDPTTKAFTKVGDFVGLSETDQQGGVIDIAVDKDGQMYGTTYTALWLIDKTNARCTKIADGTYPNSLSLVPAGTVDPSDEALVGYVNADYVRIDKTSGAVTTIGKLSNDGYVSSGDIVSVIGGGTYLTVKGNDCSDCIVEVDPKTGALKNMIGHLGQKNVFGLAFWAGSAYGFDKAGALFQINLSSGQTTLIQPGGISVASFYGAGSTTSAPVKPPK